MQQLLQPLQVQVQLQCLPCSGTPDSFCSAEQEQQQQQQQQKQHAALASSLPAALAGVQQQLQLLAGGASSSGGTALLLQLLQLAAVATPASKPSRDAAAAVCLASSAAAAAAAGAPASSHEFAWILQDHHLQQQQQLLQQQSTGNVAGSPRAAQPPQQQHQQQLLQQFLVFQAADNAQVLHVLPLQLAVAVLQLLQGLALHDESCLGLLAAGLGASSVPGSSQQLCMRRTSSWQSSSSSSRYGSTSGGNRSRSACGEAFGGGIPSVAATAAAGAGAGAGAGSSAAAEAAVGRPSQGFDVLWLPRFDRFSSSSSSSKAAAGSAVACWGPAESAVQAAVSASSSVVDAAAFAAAHISSAHISSAHGKAQQGSEPAGAAAAAAGQSFAAVQGNLLHRRRHSSLLCLLADAAACHPSLLLQVGGLLAVLAERLPVRLRQLLLVPPVSDKVLLQLLHGEGYAVRCQAAAALQALLACPAVAAALTAAALPEPADKANTAAAGTAAAVAAPGADVVMADAGAAAPLQPCNRGLGATASSTSKAAAGKAAAGTGKSVNAAEQQRQADGSNQQAGLPAAAAAAAPVAPLISNQSVYDLLFGLLDCLSVSLDEAPISGLDNSSSSSSSGVSNSGRWGQFELQRRSCGIVAQLLHNRQVALLQLLLDGAFTTGYGVAQRLLAMADAACSSAGGDPFCIASPQTPCHAAAAPRWAERPVPAAAETAGAGAACSGADAHHDRVSGTAAGDVGAICGGKHAWRECRERVRLAHESLLLLRALVASPGLIGEAALSDLCSNPAIFQSLLALRAKLSEWSEALQAAAAAAAHAPAPAAAAVPAVLVAAGAEQSQPGAGVAAAAAAAAAALPLAPWAWPFSSNCGYRGSSASSSKSSGSGGTSGSAAAAAAGASEATAQLLHSQRPPLQTCLQELSNNAASVYRRVTIYIRS
ncbi:hypothetical protein COO60DRAFT_616305 [Scenedesmus sp. NREL 46B-D3]|nr:hypothetical protein COO60DRAFT_616305 [Scenedesmus sp. NREL 46B-D3]